MAYRDKEQEKRARHEYYVRNKERIWAREHAPGTWEKRKASDNAQQKAKRQGPEGDEVRAYHKQWLRNNGIHTRIINALGAKCVRCGFDDIRALQVDHVNGGGLREEKMFKNSYQHEKYIFEHLDSGNYQVLCSNCNWIKRDEEREHMWKYGK